MAGGWWPLLCLTVRTLRREGPAGFFARVQRLASSAAGPTPGEPTASVDVERFGPATAITVAGTLDFTPGARPRVSIVIPVFNKLDLTTECLAAIQRNPQATPFEVIVVDDASTDGSGVLLPAIRGVRYLANDRNSGFIASCNRGAGAAQAEYLYFLNNDTQVQRQWLDPLVEHLDANPRAGMVGSKLLFPDGRLQEAGARLRRSTMATGGELFGELIGIGASPQLQQYTVDREVEYCSGASILVRSALFANVGGLDPRYAPAYFEDADLAYKIRAAGYKVVYVARSEVVHHLSASAGSTPDAKQQLVARNSALFSEKWQPELEKNRRIRLIAFYLPQYHPIPENDEWWGKGFTEWTNVSRARPNFVGHHQPQLPGELGFYDLRLPQVRAEQAKLAAEFGVHGFCYYHYWFSGKRLLEAPLEDMLASGQPDFPFCLCWANENWTRTWDGQDRHVLMAQTYTAGDDLAFIRSLLPALRDRRYIRIDGRPLLLVYKVGLLPDPGLTAQRWRALCTEEGVGDLYLACVHNSSNPQLNADPRAIGFDAAVEFPPLGKGVPARAPSRLLNDRFKGLYYDYPATVARLMSAADAAFPRVPRRHALVGQHRPSAGHQSHLSGLDAR